NHESHLPILFSQNSRPTLVKAQNPESAEHTARTFGVGLAGQTSLIPICKANASERKIAQIEIVSRFSKLKAVLWLNQSGTPGRTGLLRCFNLKSTDRLKTSRLDRKSTRLNSSHEWISYAVFCLKKKT